MSDIKEVVVALKNEKVCYCKQKKLYFWKDPEIEYYFSISNQKPGNAKEIYYRDTRAPFDVDEILSEWEILEKEEEKLRCLFCDCELFLHVSHRNFYSFMCSNHLCSYHTGKSKCKNEIYSIHKNIYNKLRGK